MPITHRLLKRPSRTYVADTPAAVAPVSPLAAGVWMGFLVGYVELGLIFGKIAMNHTSTVAGMRLNSHYPWMTPLGDVMIFGAVGLVLEIVRRLRKQAMPRFESAAVWFLAIFAALLTIKGLYAAAAAMLAVGIASKIGGLIGQKPQWTRPLIRWTLPAFAVVWVGLFGFRVVQLRAQENSALAVAPAAKGAPNVMLLVLDTVRARSLSLYGNSRHTTPNLDALAKTGVWFEHARSTAPWTLPSHSSMFTGRWPHELFKRAEAPLGTEFPTLAEYLGKHGYATGGFVANTYYCSSGYGLARGFAHYEDFYEDLDINPVEVVRNCELGRRLMMSLGGHNPDDTAKHADMISRDAMSWIRKHKDRPFFAFLNYFDAHVPYLVPEDHQSQFATVELSPEKRKLMIAWQKLGNHPHPPEDRELGKTCYEDCLCYLDDAVGRMLAQLQAEGVLENTLLIVTSDHGENHGEHSLYCHGQGLYRTETHVPLIVSWPGKVPAAGKLSAPATLRDLPATIVDLLGRRQGSPFPGLSMARHWTGESPRADVEDPSNGFVLSELMLDEAKQRSQIAPVSRGAMQSLIDDGKVYIRNGDGVEELYDLAGDPEDSHDLAKEPASAPVLEKFRGMLGKAMKK